MSDSLVVRWIFRDVDPDAIELERDANGFLARVLEHGAFVARTVLRIGSSLSKDCLLCRTFPVEDYGVAVTS